MTMRSIFLITALSAIPLATIAQLAPNTKAPIAAHLLEVNAQWRVMDPSPTGGDLPARFENDAQRIGAHLHRVASTLRTHASDGITDAAKSRRDELLDALDAYADRGRFPQNYVLPYRNPIFIDPHHTACAVGQLMIESGNGSLAERISRDMNLAYVREMPGTPLWPVIAAWADDHGFTADELAWIQPAYAPPTNWYDLGNGTDARVTKLLVLDNGELLLTGEFNSGGGIACQQVASWNGAYYQPLGSGVSGTAVAAAEFNGMLYLGGSFQGGLTDLAIWDGASWNYASAGPGMSPYVHDLHVFNGELYAATEWSGFAGWTYQVMKLDAGNWLPHGYPFDAPVYTLGDFAGQLVAGGAFTQSISPMDPLLGHVASFNGDWYQLANGVDAPVHDLRVLNDTLYAGGDLYINIVPSFGLARVVAGAPDWELLMPNHTAYIIPGVGPTYINTLAYRNGSLYFGGEFGIMVGLSYGTNLGQFIGTDNVAPLAVFDGTINSLVAFGNDLIAGGDFTQSNFAPTPYVAYTDLSVGVPEGTPMANLDGLWPNPASDVIALPVAQFRGQRARVVDATGRQVLEDRMISSDLLRMDVSALSPGAYHLQVLGGATIRSAVFVKQ